MYQIFITALIIVCSNVAGTDVLQENPTSSSTHQIYFPFSEKCLEFDRGLKIDGAHTRQFECCSDLSRQLFRIKRLSNGGFHIVSAHSDRCLASSGPAEGAFVHQVKCSEDNPFQVWSLGCIENEKDKIQLKLLFNKTSCITMHERSKNNLAKFQMFRCSGSEHQLFGFLPGFTVPPHSGFSQTTIYSRSQEVCLEVFNGSTENNVEIVAGICDGSKKQLFGFQTVNKGFLIKSILTKKCWTVNNRHVIHLQHVVQSDCNDDDDYQIFTVEYLENSKLLIRTVVERYYANQDGGVPGYPLKLWEYEENNSKFEINQIEECI